ncbi:MAG TPA: penicillin-binding protein, partial [Ktedonobacter sp.]|nr:penicillin-binding protein [Ktedonobacter sp.]
DEGCDPLRVEHGALVAWKKNISAFPPIGSSDAGAYVTATHLDRFLWKVKTGILLSQQSTAAFFTSQVLHHTQDDWKQVYG